MTNFNKLDARKSQQYGNELHLIAIATYLKLRIFVYQSFDEESKFCINELNSLQLNYKFTQNEEQFKKHLTFIPIEHIDNNNFISGFYDPITHHYTALVPNTKTAFEFKPMTIFNNLGVELDNNVDVNLNTIKNHKTN